MPYDYDEDELIQIDPQILEAARKHCDRANQNLEKFIETAIANELLARNRLDSQFELEQQRQQLEALWRKH